MQLAPISDRSESPCSEAALLLSGDGGLVLDSGSSPLVSLPKGVEKWRLLIDRYAYENGVPPCLVAAVIGTESGGDPDAVSSAGCVGLMQLTPRYFGGDAYALTDPDTNVDKGSAHLAKLLRQFKGNLVKALAAYNAGSPRCGVARGCDPNRWNLVLNCGHAGSYVDQVAGMWNAALRSNYRLLPAKPRAVRRRAWSWTGFAFGVAIGIGANVARQRWR